MGVGREASRNRRMSQIRVAAEELLTESSLEDITMKQVAQRARVGEATVFRYLGSKDALLFLVYGDRMDELLNSIEEDDMRLSVAYRERLELECSFFERVLEIYRRRCEFYLENPHNAALYLRAGFDPSNPQRWRNMAQGDRTIDLCMRILAEGVKCEAVRSDVDLSAVAQNCHAIYIHEIDRTPTRGLDSASIWDRVRKRLEAQLFPLAMRSTHP